MHSTKVMNMGVKTNSAKAWLLAARPKTLTGAAVPVAIALALAYWQRGGSLTLIPAALCLLFAFIMQINANLINDYFDFAHGIDREDRLGPERACAQGWITLEAMKRGIAVTIALAFLVGLPLIYWGGWEMLGVGVACIVFSFLYTTLLSRKAMGDVLVVLFFGIVPVCATFYLQTGMVSCDALLLSLGCGFATDNLLIVNNFRDRGTDAQHGKTTLVTIVGERIAFALYSIMAIAALAMALIVVPQLNGKTNWLALALLLLYPIAVVGVQMKMKRIWRGKALNKVLGMTSMTILLYGIVVCVGIMRNS